jgi:hypothetical protein
MAGMSEAMQAELRFGSQCDMILDAMQRGESISALAALRQFGCFRLAARINDLKRLGHIIRKETVERNGKRFAVYSMGGETRGER